MEALLGPNPSPALKAEASPITHVSADDPPRVPNRRVTVEGGTHGRNWFRVPDTAAWQRALVEWLNSYLQPRLRHHCCGQMSM